MKSRQHVVTISFFTSGSHALVDRPILTVSSQDTIEFQNSTTGPAELWFADDDVLDGLPPMPKEIAAGGRQTFRVIAEPSDDCAVYEYVVRVTLDNRRRVFAVGASTPKIIIRPSGA